MNPFIQPVQLPGPRYYLTSCNPSWNLLSGLEKKEVRPPYTTNPLSRHALLWICCSARSITLQKHLQESMYPSIHPTTASILFYLTSRNPSWAINVRQPILEKSIAPTMMPSFWHSHLWICCSAWSITPCSHQNISIYPYILSAGTIFNFPHTLTLR